MKSMFSCTNVDSRYQSKELIPDFKVGLILLHTYDTRNEILIFKVTLKDLSLQILLN